MANLKLNPDDRTKFEKLMGVKKPKARIPKYGPKGPTKISADKRTSSQRLAGSVRAKVYKRVAEKIEEHAGKGKGASYAQKKANSAAAKAVTAAEKAATARRRKRLADLKKRGVKPSNKFDLE